MNSLTITTPNTCRKILSYVTPEDVCNFEQISKPCKHAVESDLVWNEFVDKNIYFSVDLSAKNNFIQSRLSRVNKFLLLCAEINLLNQYEDTSKREAITVKLLERFRGQQDMVDAFNKMVNYFHTPLGVPVIVEPYEVFKLYAYKLNMYDTITELILSKKLMVDEIIPLNEQQKKLIEKLYSKIDIKHIPIEKALTLNEEEIKHLITVKWFINQGFLTIDRAFNLDKDNITRLEYAKPLIAEKSLTVNSAISLSLAEIIRLRKQFVLRA